MRKCLFYGESQLEIFSLKIDNFYSSQKVKKGTFQNSICHFLNRGLLEITSARGTYDAKYT